MSKLAYFSMTLIGAIPAGGSGYLLVQHFLDHGFSGSPVVIGVAGTALAAMLLIALTPLMVLFWYKSPSANAVKTAAAPAVAPVENNKPDAKPGKGKKKTDDDDFGDAIPDDFDENELNESADDAFDADDEDFEYEDDEFEEEEPPKKKKKK